MAAIINMTTELAKSLAHRGITLHTVSPGTILTDTLVEMSTGWARQLGWETDDWHEIEGRFTSEVMPQPANHFGRPEDIARTVAFIASPLSSYMTDANYRVDGGVCRSVN